MSVSKKILGRDRQLINKIKKHFETYGGISVVDFPEYEEVVQLSNICYKNSKNKNSS